MDNILHFNALMITSLAQMTAKNHGDHCKVTSGKCFMILLPKPEPVTFCVLKE